MRDRPAVRKRSGRHLQWGWLTPPLVCVLVFVATPFGLLDQLLGLAFGVPLIVVSMRRPGASLLVLAVFLPFQAYLVALAYHIGVPLPVVRGAGWLKEALVVGIVAASVHAVRTTHRRLDLLDRIALLWCGGVVLYALLPQVLSAAGAPTSIDIRLQGIRANAFFVLLFLGARHAPLPARFSISLRRTIIVVAAVVAGAGLYQFLNPQGWIDFTFKTIDVPRYQREVLGLSLQQVNSGFLWASESPVRVGSVFISPFEYSDFLLLGLALASDRVLRGRPPPILVAATVVLGLGIVVSNTRIDLIGALLIVAVVLRRASGRLVSARVAAGAVFAISFILLAPFLVGTRVTGADGGSESSRAHVQEFTTGVEHLIQDPRGRGLGTAPGVGSRFELEQTFTSDNSILQVGNELGLLMMLLFVALLVALLRALFATQRDGEASGLAAALGAAGVGLVLVGMVHHVWLTLSVAWLFFGAAGVALSVDRSGHAVSGALEQPPLTQLGPRQPAS